MKRTENSAMVDSTSGWKSSTGKIYQRNSARAITCNGTAKANAFNNREATATTNMKRGSNKILQYYTANETDEERERQPPTFQQNAVNRIRNKTDEERQRWTFTVKIIFFDATIGSKNYIICEMHMRNIFPTD